jgi:hypothetical protein
MQYQVPQFIESEDTIIGPFSLRQFLYIGAAILISVMFYFFVQTWLFILIAVILVGCAIMASFLKIEGRSIVDVAVSATNFYWKPQIYVWKADHPIMQQKHAEESEGAGSELLKNILAESPHREKPIETEAGRSELLSKILTESPLHKSWENLQSGTPDAKIISDRQFLEKKTNERYEIFHKNAGDRGAARRIDYR